MGTWGEEDPAWGSGPVQARRLRLRRFSSASGATMSGARRTHRPSTRIQLSPKQVLERSRPLTRSPAQHGEAPSNWMLLRSINPSVEADGAGHPVTRVRSADRMGATWPSCRRFCRQVGSAGRVAKDVQAFDDELPGFGIRKFASGAASYFVKYNVGTQQCRKTLGRV